MKNKWVETLLAKFATNQITLADAEREIKTRASQTQQETLEWCLDEVVGEDDKPTGMYYDNIEDMLIRNTLRDKQRQTIKQRIKSLEGEKWNS